MSWLHRPLCALFGGHHFVIYGRRVICTYCGYESKDKR